MSARTDGRRTLLVGAGLLGFGLGAVLDVLVFHLVLQWHHLLSDVYDPTTLSGLRTNLYADGVFSLVALGVAFAGAGLIWRALNRSPEPNSVIRALGGVLVGAGAFNLVDGVVDHYVLDVHDAVHGTASLNPHWIGASLLLLGVGVLLLAE